jgi:hypothetical protein
MEDALLHVFGPAQLGDPREDARRARERAKSPAAPVQLVPGGWERRGTPGNYYIVAVDHAKDPA